LNFIPNIGLFDWALAVLFLFIIYFFAFIYRNKKIDDNPEYKYFLAGLTAKLIGGVGFALFSIYYYKGGDTFVFFNPARDLNAYFISDFGNAINVMFTSASELNLDQYDFSPLYSYVLTDKDVFSIVKITTLINFFTFSSYLVTTIVFAFLSFLGLWFGYSNFCRLYPKSSKLMFIAFMLIPSTLLWSSGILKDTVTQASIAWLLYTFSNIFIFKRKILLSITISIIAVYMLALLKPYILYALLPCLFLWVQSNIKNLIANRILRLLLKPFIIVLMGGFAFYLFQQVSVSAGRYNFENIEKTLVGFQSWHEYLSDTRDQSGYTLGEMEITPLGILKKTPAALNVTFFRPYLWEVRNLPTFLGAIEALVLFLFFIYLLMVLRFRFFSIMVKNKEVFFMMLFAIIFGIIVGVSSYNFGALSRYKMPASLFFTLSLILIYQLGKDRKQQH